MRSLGRVTDLLDLTARLVDIPSESHDESAITSWLEAELRRDAPWLVIERIGLNLVARTQLGRSGELNNKAQAQADRMANRGRIYHSTNLAAGVSPGWQLIGENVAVAGSIEQAQSALEASPGHLANMLNGGFTEVGIGVTNSNGRVYVVQVFVGR